jgi:hypothetical protein
LLLLLKTAPWRKTGLGVKKMFNSLEGEEEVRRQAWRVIHEPVADSIGLNCVDDVSLSPSFHPT